MATTVESKSVVHQKLNHARVDTNLRTFCVHLQTRGFRLVTAELRIWGE